ncbi:hypothetical protein [Acidisoma sp.]|uniref:hypothetical protein n=1 Tax=Acidisoma sp. TaxID=1872115 RepID=UPI003B00E4C2
MSDVPQKIADGLGLRDIQGLLDIDEWKGSEFSFRPATMARLEKLGCTLLVSRNKRGCSYRITPRGQAVAAITRQKNRSATLTESPAEHGQRTS